MKELEEDYRAMRPMFLTEPPTFATVAETLSSLESKINH